MNRIGGIQSQKHGSVIVLVMFVTAILSLLGTAVLSLGLNSRVFAARSATQIAARCAADAGLEKAIFEMNEKLKAGALDVYDPTTTPVLSWATDESLPNCDATFSYKILAKSIVSKSEFKIECIGKCCQAIKKVYADVELQQQSPFEHAIFVHNDIVLKPNTVIDGYNGGEGGNLKIGTNSIEAASITMGKDAIVNGDVAVGVGADPDVVISATQATITGKTYALTEENELPSVTVPEWLESMPSQGTIKKSTTIATSGKYDAIYLGRGKVITIDGSVSLYVTGDVSLSNSAQLQIADTNPDAYLTLYLGGNLSCKNGGQINNLTKDPRKLQIYGLDSCTNISMDTASIFYGAIYAPSAPVYLKSALEIYGAVIANEFIQGSTSNFHYDAALRDITPVAGCQYFVVTRWYEE